MVNRSILIGIILTAIQLILLSFQIFISNHPNILLIIPSMALGGSYVIAIGFSKAANAREKSLV